MTATAGLGTGEVGYIATGLKDAKLAKIGDTITMQQSDKLPVNPLPGYQEPKPMVFLSLFPVDSDEFVSSRDAMEKLRLSDSAFTFRPVSSQALGNGFHCGFLGLLHAEVVQERILREFGLTMIATAPSVEYRLTLGTGENRTIQSAAEFPDPSHVAEVKEPVMRVEMYTPKPYVGAVMQLAVEKRGEHTDMRYEGETAHLTYLMPLSDMIIDFFDRLKSVTSGYASLDYEFFDWQRVEVVKLDILLNHEKVDALSFLAVSSQAEQRGREIVEKLATVIPRQQFLIPVQAAIGGRVVARADVKAFRKDVTQKLYGGDRTRKDKLLDKQKKGKAKMKMVGRVEIPQSAFFEVLKRS
jgi:GTP-binding protein LepA